MVGGRDRTRTRPLKQNLTPLARLLCSMWPRPLRIPSWMALAHFRSHFPSPCHSSSPQVGDSLPIPRPPWLCCCVTSFVWRLAGFIDREADQVEDVERPSMHHRRMAQEDEMNEMSEEEYARMLEERYRRVSEGAGLDDMEATEVEQQALLPSVRDTKLWMVKCRVRSLQPTTALYGRGPPAGSVSSSSEACAQLASHLPSCLTMAPEVASRRLTPVSLSSLGVLSAAAWGGAGCSAEPHAEVCEPEHKWAQRWGDHAWDHVRHSSGWSQGAHLRGGDERAARQGGERQQQIHTELSCAVPVYG